MICEIRFGESEKEFSYYDEKLQLNLGDLVIFRPTKGEEIGKIIRFIHAPFRGVHRNGAPRRMETGHAHQRRAGFIKSVRPLTNVLRKASQQDIEEYRRIREEESRIQGFCNNNAKGLGLPIKVVSTHIQFDLSTLRLDFLAEGRPNLRSLVHRLSEIYKGRIILHQIGLRSYTKRFEACGVCGRPICCATFLTEFKPITINLAKLQGLSCGAPKLTGVCGRLMCCLAYEREAYEEAKKQLPKPGDQIRTDKGEALVTGVKLLEGLIGVQYLDGKKETIKLDEIKNG